MALIAILSLPLHAAEAIDPDVLAVREAAWQAWFAGDEAALRAMLPDDFLAIGWSGSEISDREKAIASSREFRKAGGNWSHFHFPKRARSASAIPSFSMEATT